MKSARKPKPKLEKPDKPDKDELERREMTRILQDVQHLVLVTPRPRLTLKRALRALFPTIYRLVK